MAMSSAIRKILFAGLWIVLGGAAVFILGEFYIPKSFDAGEPLAFVVQRGWGNREIAENLEKEGIVRKGWSFRLYAVVSGESSELKAGKYGFSSSMSVADIVKKMASGETMKEKITVIEGWTAKDIAEELKRKNFIQAEDFLKANAGEWSGRFDFLKDAPKTAGLEGFLFPDTYEIYDGETAEEFTKIILENFDKKLSSDLRREMRLRGKTIFQTITIASILEKEVRPLEDKKIVAGVLRKRLAAGMPLQIDSTVNYITGKNSPRISAQDQKIDSPYNTYKYRGLPPSPISNPGTESILAAIYPEDSPYWYYLSAEGSGATIFSETLEEHNKAVAKYLTGKK